MAASAIRSAMPDQHRQFFESLPLLFPGLLDGHGRPWATAAFGPTGFLKSPSPQELVLGSEPVLAEEFQLDTAPGARVATLGIDFPTRRRNRMNGRVHSRRGGGIAIAVDQSFGNCPQYIQPRSIEVPGNRPVVTRKRAHLQHDAVQRITRQAAGRPAIR